MKLIDRTKKLIIIAFLLSLLFHTSSILYFLWQGTDKQKPHSLQDKENEPKQDNQHKEQWVETKARKNNFGAPVIFQDIPNEQKIIEQEETTAPEQPLQETLKKIQDIKEPENKPFQNIRPDKADPEEKNVSLQKLQQKSIPNSKQSLPQKKPTPSPQKTIKTPHQIKKNNNQPQTVAKKPPLSLAQLTQGFLNHVKDEGTHAIHMLGKKTGIPSDEQIKHERYLQKISWCLQNSFNINNDRFPRSVTSAANLHIQLSLNRDGSMKNCNVVKTSGNLHIDKFTLFVFNDASSSFPPVPQYLPYDPFSVTYVITLNANEQNSFGFYRR